MRSIILTFFVLSIAACGGGGGGAPAASPTPPMPTADADPGGMWVGALENADSTFEELIGITTSDGRFTLISLDTFGPDTFGQYVGTAMVDGSDISGAGSAYAQPGATWSDGSTVLDITVTAVVDEQTTLSGSWQNSIGEIVTFELDYDSEYERDSSLALLEGVWYVYDDLLNPTLTLTMEADGSFSGQNTAGCQSLGQVTLIDAAFNIYGWGVTISACPIAGDYSGFAVLGDADIGQNNVVLVSISNDERALLLPLER